MTNKSFAHLHVHGAGSKLDGLSQIPDLVKVAEELGQPAVAITDHGSMSATYDLYKATKDNPVKPIYGIEAYFAPDVPRTHKEPVRWNPEGDKGDDVSGAGAYTHMTMWAETSEGLKNLFRLSSEAYDTGFYRQPRMDLDILQQWNKGVMATTGCPSGEVQTWLRIGDYDKAVAAAAKFADILGKDNYFVEVMDHGLSIETRVIPGLLQIAKDLGLRTVATNDSHYTRHGDAHVHDALLCIGSGSKLADPDRFKFDGDGYYIKSAAEMRRIWDDVAPDACDTTLLIAERANATFEHYDYLMPEYPVPAGETEASWFEKEVDRGMRERFPNGAGDEYTTRVKYEVDIINQMKFPGYFLVVADYIQWAKKQGIRVGPGRGSGAGSLVAYALSITDVDPLRHNLMFERFLNPERISMPDFDIDFDDRRRGEVIEYVKEKYGTDRVAGIATFSIMKGKSAIKDSVRVLGLPYMLGDKLSKVYPPAIVGRDMPLKDIFDPSSERYDEALEFRNTVQGDPDAQAAVDLALGLEGTQRGYGMHAAGIIMSSRPLTDVLPMMRRDTNSPMTTSLEMSSAEKLGLVKMDFLGLSNLGTLDETLRLIKANRGIDVDLDQIGRDLDDQKTYDLVAAGETLGVFQLDSPPMRSLLKLMAPDRFEDISAVLALYRPGPMGVNAHIDYADRKNGRKPVVPIHPELADALEPILGETYGLVIYQEQVMKAAQELAGYSLGKADLLRRAMGKKSKEILAQEFAPFQAGMRESGFSDASIQALWDVLVPFSDYAFNRAHTAAYGLVSYWTAYLKANFPTEYMAALLTTNADNKDKLALYLGECRRMGVKVLPPDVNSSELNYTAVGDVILTGLIGVKGIGEAGINAWLTERKAGGKAAGFGDFLMRGETAMSSKRAVEALIHAGAFDCFGHSRAALSLIHEDACEIARKAKKSRKSNVASLFDDVMPEFNTVVIDVPEVEEWEKNYKLSKEREVLGLYVSGHPLSDYEDALSLLSSHSIAYLQDAENPPSEAIKIAGLVTAVDRKVTKKSGEPWAIVTVEDFDSAMQVYVFPRTYAEVSDLLKPDAILLFSGRAEKRDDGSTTFAVRDVSSPDMKAAQRKAARAAAAAEAAGHSEEQVKEAVRKADPVVAASHRDDGNTDPVTIKVAETQLTEANTVRFKAILEEFHGSRPVHLVISKSDGTIVTMALGANLTVVGTAQLAAEIRALFGVEAV